MERIDKNTYLITAILATILVASMTLRPIFTVSSTVITVPDNYATIQEAIDAAQEGDTVFVRAGQYNESITIDKSLNLTGENRETTIIDGNYAKKIVLVKANYVNITGFTIQNSAIGNILTVVDFAQEKPIGAISLIGSIGCTIKNNTMQRVSAGVHICKGSSNITVSDNRIIFDEGYASLISFGVVILAVSSPVSGTTISNNHIEGYTRWGLLIMGSNNKITGNDIYCNILSSGCGIHLVGNVSRFLGSLPLPYPSDYNIVSNNKVGSNPYGILVEKSNNNIVSNNIFSLNSGGFYLKGSNGNTLRDNDLTSFGMEGSELSHFMNDIDTSNTVYVKVGGRKPIYVLVNQSDLRINPYTYPSMGYLGIVNSKNITLWRLNVMNNMQGIMLAQTTKSEIAEASLHSNQVGIYLWNCSENTIMGNMITSSFLSQAIAGDVGGAGIDMILCTKNTLRGNTFSDNFVGVRLNGSSNNVFYRNNFVSNDVQIEDDLANTWDDRNSDRSADRDRCPVCGQPRSVGNYWDDYTGQDDGSPTQAHNCPGDGIGDTLLSHHGVDCYPLMKPWIPVLGDLDYNGVVNILDVAKIAMNFRKPSP